ncbi:MAG: hypothetical protein DCF20_07820 [Pseudanabaena sp.]|nr:MAG: hypothetical protein DCF20_07820 [Pseudanabaena sp.]
MASNKNIPQKGQGTNEPDKKQSVKADAADVDWMIMSDIGTRIGGSPEIESGANESSASASSQVISNQQADNDLEDLEWLRSLGLDEAIEPSSPSKITVNSQSSSLSNNSEVSDIDWLIVTDLNDRKDDSGIKGQANPSSQNTGQSLTTLQPLSDNIMDNLGESLGLDGLDFLESSDFSNLDSLGLGISESVSIENTEDGIQGLAELLENRDDSSFDLNSGGDDDSWDSISSILEGNSFNQPSGGSLDIVSESFEMPTQFSEISGATKENDDSVDSLSDQLYEADYAEDLLVGDLELSDDIEVDQTSKDFEIDNEIQSNLQDELQISQDQDLSFDEFEVDNLAAEFDNKIDDDFGASQPLEFDAQSTDEDDIWASNSSNLEPEILSESVDNAFTNDWGESVEAAIDDDSVWDATPSIDVNLVSATSIDNAFGDSDEWKSVPDANQYEVEGNIDFEMPNLESSEAEDYDSFELSNADSSLEFIEPVFDLGFELQTEDLSHLESPEMEEESVDFEIVNLDSDSILEQVLETELESVYNLQTEPILEQTDNQLGLESEFKLQADDLTYLDSSTEQSDDLTYLVSSELEEQVGVLDEKWESMPNANQYEAEEHIDFELPSLESLETEEYVSIGSSNVDSSLKTIEPVFDSEFDLQTNSNLEQTDNELEFGINNDEDWSGGLESEVIATGVSDETDWSASLEAEIGNGNDVVWDEELVEIEDYLPTLEESSEKFNDDFRLTEQSLSEDFDFGLDEDDWAIANNISKLVANSREHETSDFDDALENLDIPEQIPDRQQFTDFNEFDNLSHDDIEASLESNEFEFFEKSGSIPPSPDWESHSNSIAEQVNDSDFANYADDLSVEQLAASGLIDDFANYADDFDRDLVSPVNSNLTSSNLDMSNAESLIGDSRNDVDNLGSMLVENFDLAAFEDSLSEALDSDFSLENIPTTLTPNRILSDVPSEESLRGFLNSQSSTNPIDSFADNNIVSEKDLLEEALGNDLLNDNYEEVNFQEEALVHDLLNGFVSESDNFDNLVSANESFTMPPAMPSPKSNLTPPSNFDMGAIDRDFLDDFDLESFDPLTDGGFDDGFVAAPISTGLTPSAPPIAPMPPSLPPLTKQEPTTPTINSLLPLPSLPPLPPKRNPTQGSKSPSPAFPVANVGGQPMPQNRKPISSIDDEWSDLLDVDTVLSGELSSISGPITPSGGKSLQRASQGRSSRDFSPSSISKRKETGLPDFNDLGLEIHDENADWSGLLDSGDLSDSITTINPYDTQLPSRIRTNPTATSRSDVTGVSETREIPRERRKPMMGFGDSTQARLAATPDQIDFNRFTEDNYGGYEYEQQVAPLPAEAPSKRKLTMPSVNFESLWQNYFKIPAIGLGAIGGAFVLYTVLNRPVFDLGLRWGLFKDASGKDFTNADFKGAKLDNVDFSKSILTGAKMQDASLVGANFQEANLDGANFTNANLSRARLIQSSVIWSEFNKAQMNLVDFAGANLTRSNFVGAKMDGANLKDSKIGAQGTEQATKFSPTTLLAWQIVNEPREGRNLANQDLSGLNLSFTSLKRANLTNVKLNYTDMTNTDLSGANLSDGEINGTNWSGAKLNGINLTRVAFDKNKLPKTDEGTICPNGKKGPCKF